jgi:hypothetical protein
MNKYGLICMLSLVIFAAAADTKPVKNPDGNCTASVPTNWTVNALGMATSPDKKVSLVISSPKHGLQTLAQVQQMAPNVYKEDKVTKSSPTEFEMEGNSISGKPNVYRAVPAGDKVCIAEITYENGNVATARSTVGTLKAAK